MCALDASVHLDVGGPGPSGGHHAAATATATATATLLALLLCLLLPLLLRLLLHLAAHHPTLPAQLEAPIHAIPCPAQVLSPTKTDIIGWMEANNKL